MVKQLVKTYYKLLDEKLENWTMVVLIIAALIVSASFITKDTNAWLYTKNNILEYKQSVNNNIIEINWVYYKIILEEFSK
jgi:uncharacterized membrane protein